MINQSIHKQKHALLMVPLAENVVGKREQIDNLKHCEKVKSAHYC